MSTMIGQVVDAIVPVEISDLTARVIGGGEITRDEALRTLCLESTADIFDLMARGQPHRGTFQGQQDSPVFHCQRQGGRVLGELQFLRAVVLLPDRLAALWLCGPGTGSGGGGRGRQERRHRAWAWSRLGRV